MAGGMKGSKLMAVATAWLALAPVIAGAAPGFREALGVLERERGAAVVVNVVGIVGFNGDDQPDIWKFLVLDEPDADRLREISVSGGRVSGEAELSRSEYEDLPEKPVTAAALKVDSTEAYRIADDEAILAGASFTRLHYQLRFRGDDEAPTWLVTLVDPVGKAVGHVVIDAADGSIPFLDFPAANLLVQGQGEDAAAAGSRSTYATGTPLRFRDRIFGSRQKRSGSSR